MWHELSHEFVHKFIGLEGKLAEAVHFFIYDTVKIWFLLVTIIFAVSFLRTWFNTEYVRAHLQGKPALYGHAAAAGFGIITPFCSCSAIPLFLGFIQAASHWE